MSNYSIDTILAELIRVSQNSIEIVSKLSDATTTQDSEVTINMTLSDGTVKSYSYPSLGHLMNEFNRLDRDIQRLLGITDDGSISVRLADGSYSTVFLEKFSIEPATMTGLPVPSTFSKQNNWFFEQFLNPLLYVSFDVQNKIDERAERALIKRLILTLDTQEKLDYFNESISGKNDLEYNVTLKNLSARGISYFVDEDTIPLPVSIVRYVGSFDVSNIVDEPVTTLIDGVEVKTSKRKYFLNKLTYTDNNEPVKDNKFLQVGAILIRKENTKYKVLEVNNSEKYVVLERFAGNSAIGIGANQLKIEPGRFANKEIRVNVGFDEKQIIWVRAIEPNFEVAATEWGNGVGIYTNTLTIETASGNVSLEDFYLNEVSDFGKIFLSAAKEKPIPAVDGVTPNSPTLTAENFKVVRVDAHKDESQAIEDIKAKQAERLKVASEIEKLNTSIINKTKELNTKVASDAQKLAIKTELDNLIKQKSSKSTYYSSLITDLVAKGKELGGGLSKPKYAIRGFFPLPEVQKGTTGNQELVQFVTSYRYLRKDGSASNAQQNQFVNNSGTLQQAVFSDWIEILGPVRKREYNTVTGKYEWVVDDPASADIVNINQISLPISSGEQVEFRVRSVSEAGWPTNPLLSEWSESIIQGFDDSLPVGNETQFIITEANSEDIRLKFQQELTAVDQHISTSFNNGEKYYAHTLEDLASGFFDSNNQIVNAYQKIKEHEESIAALVKATNSTIESAGIQISIIDPSNGKKTIIKSGETIELDAGYYTDLVDVSNPANWGSIVNKVWNVTVENTSTSPLELVSIFNNDVFKPLLEIGDSQADRYKNVPLNISNIKEGEEVYYDNGGATLYSFVNPNGYQSAQVVNQWIYTRQRSISGIELYDIVTNTNKGLVNGSTSGSTNIVKMQQVSNFSNPLAAPGSWVHQQLTSFGLTDEFTYIDLYDFWNTLYQYNGIPNIIGTSIQTNKSYPAEIISNFRDSTNSKLNSFYKNQVYKAANAAPFDYTLLSPMKTSFFSNDKFLVGKDTCLDYFFLSPDSYQTIQVPGTFSFSSKKVNNGEANAIKIPLIYQYRMIDRKSTIVGGSDQSSQKRNLNWNKKIGVDIFYKDSGNIEVFSFDVKVNSNYRKTKQV